MSTIIQKLLPKRKEKTSLRISKIVRITPCKRHAWVETDKGIFRKPIEKVPAGLLK